MEHHPRQEPVTQFVPEPTQMLRIPTSRGRGGLDLDTEESPGVQFHHEVDFLPTTAGPKVVESPTELPTNPLSTMYRLDSVTSRERRFVLHAGTRSRTKRLVSRLSYEAAVLAFTAAAS